MDRHLAKIPKEVESGWGGVYLYDIPLNRRIHVPHSHRSAFLQRVFYLPGVFTIRFILFNAGHLCHCRSFQRMFYIVEMIWCVILVLTLY